MLLSRLSLFVVFLSAASPAQSGDKMPAEIGFHLVPAAAEQAGDESEPGLVFGLFEREFIACDACRVFEIDAGDGGKIRVTAQSEPGFSVPVADLELLQLLENRNPLAPADTAPVWVAFAKLSDVAQTRLRAFFDQYPFDSVVITLDGDPVMLMPGPVTSDVPLKAAGSRDELQAFADAFLADYGVPSEWLVFDAAAFEQQREELGKQLGRVP